MNVKELFKSNNTKREDNTESKERVRVLESNTGLGSLPDQTKSDLICDNTCLPGPTILGVQEELKPINMDLSNEALGSDKKPIPDNETLLPRQEIVKPDNTLQGKIKRFGQLFKRDPEKEIREKFLQPKVINEFLVEMGFLALMPPELIKMSVVNFFNCFNDHNTCVKLLMFGYKMDIVKAKNFATLIDKNRILLRKELKKNGE